MKQNKIKNPFNTKNSFGYKIFNPIVRAINNIITSFDNGEIKVAGLFEDIYMKINDLNDKVDSIKIPDIPESQVLSADNETIKIENDVIKSNLFDRNYKLLYLHEDINEIQFININSEQNVYNSIKADNYNDIVLTHNYNDGSSDGSTTLIIGEEGLQLSNSYSGTMTVTPNNMSLVDYNKNIYFNVTPDGITLGKEYTEISFAKKIHIGSNAGILYFQAPNFKIEFNNNTLIGYKNSIAFGKLNNEYEIGELAAFTEQQIAILSQISEPSTSSNFLYTIYTQTESNYKKLNNLLSNYDLIKAQITGFTEPYPLT
jgi:hypothetical protein